MEEIKVGEYIRSDSGKILKYEYLKKYEDEVCLGQEGKCWSFEDEEELEDFIEQRIVKHSENIIDLIEEDDIGIMNYNGMIFRKFITLDDILELKVEHYKLLRLVTKEQFKSVEYVIEEDK